MIAKGQKLPKGERLTAEKRTKILEMRRSGKKWKEIAAELGVPVKRAMSWAKRIWYKNGMKSEAPIIEVKEAPVVEVKEAPIAEKKEEKVEAPVKEGVVEKIKEKAAKNVDAAVTKHIKKSDKAPKTVSKVANMKKEAGGALEEAKTGGNERKSVNIWFLVAIILAVVTIGVIFLILKPKNEEKAKYNEPIKEKETGFEGRSMEDL